MTVSVVNGYTTVADFARYANVDATTYNDDLANAINMASRQIDAWCFRHFYVEASADRAYFLRNASTVQIDDAATVTAVKISTSDDGVYGTTLTAGQYLTEPLNGVVDGISGYPITRLRFASSVNIPPATGQHQPNVLVTGTWGWAAVPLPIRQATLTIALETFKMKEAPFGVAGFAEFGPVRVGRMSPQAIALMAPYRTGSGIAGLA
jgi:hypothetical protein